MKQAVVRVYSASLRRIQAVL